MEVIVNSKEQLEKAKSENADTIIINGEFADKLKKTKKITTLSAVALATLTGIIAASTLAAPVTGGASLGVGFAATATAATFTGLEIATIIAASTIGISLILAIFKDYEEISYESGKMTLRKKAKND